MRKIIGLITLFLVASIGTYIYWNYLLVDEAGVREGIVQKFSRKGQVFKTYEGELLGGGFGRVGSNFQAQYFYFSVEDPQVASFIEANAGRNLTLRYVKYQKSLPWRGENYANNKKSQGQNNQDKGQYIVQEATLNANNNTTTPDPQKAVQENPDPIGY